MHADLANAAVAFVDQLLATERERARQRLTAMCMHPLHIEQALDIAANMHAGQISMVERQAHGKELH